MDPTVYRIKELNIDLIRPNTSNFKDPESYGSKIVVIGKPGCFTRGTKILMYNGELESVENVQVTQQVMGDDSTPRTVLELCHNYDEMFKIIQDNGESYTLNKQHKLVLTSDVDKTDITEITVENYLNETQEFKDKMKIYKTSVQFPEKQVNIDPFFFGSWLSSENTVLPNDILVKYHLQNDKYIPTDFKINSHEIRLQLLAGILNISPDIFFNNNDYIFSSQNTKFFNDVKFLVGSLGFPIKRLDNFSFKILRNTDYLLSNFQVQPMGYGEYFGFTLDGNHRFLLGDFDVVRNTGKSTLIASILYAKKHIFPVAIAFSGTEDSNGFYRKIMPSTFVFNEYSEDKIKNFIRRQKIARQHLENPWAAIMIDDCTDDPRILATPLQQGMFKRGRHWKCLYILSLQYSMDVKPVIRTNVDGVFILREPIMKNRKSLWENYASIIPDFTLFCEVLDQLTDNYTALYINNQTRSNNWQECVFWYKAPIVPEDFKFGAPEYWDFHNERFDKTYLDNFDQI